MVFIPLLLKLSDARLECLDLGILSFVFIELVARLRGRRG
jgi:hypothetical protein